MIAKMRSTLFVAAMGLVLSVGSVDSLVPEAQAAPSTLMFAGRSAATSPYQTLQWQRWTLLKMEPMLTFL